MELTPYQNTQTPLNDAASRPGHACLDASRTRVVATSQNQHLEMALITTEGDRVTLSLDSQSHSLTAGYAEMHAGPGQVSLSQGEWFAGDLEEAMSLTVEGDLNEQEKKDLQKVLKTLKKMMGQFVNDRLKPMLAQAKQLGKLETLAGAEVEMSYSRQDLVAEQTRISAIYNQQGALERPDRPEPPAQQPSRPEDNWRAIHREAEALTKAMAAQLKQVPSFIDEMHGRIRAMFDQFRDQLATWNPAEPAGPDLIDKMREDLVAKAFAQEVQPGSVISDRSSKHASNG